MVLAKGTCVGPYEIGDAIGAGGMGEVFRARDTKLHRDVAVKVLPDALANEPERLARFEREAVVLAALNHPNIAHVYGLEMHQARDSRRPCIVMEFVDGADLAQRIAVAPLPLDEALAIARQLVDALDAAHEQGIVHRDLKPANIKVTTDGTVKVLDFGLAKALEAPRGSGGMHASLSPTITTPAQMTHAGVVLGTAAYMSPEQAKGKPIDKRADIWAFGCVLFEMLTGRAVFAADTVTETLAAVMRDAPPLDRLPSGTPPRVARLIARCLERDLKQRLRDIGDARLELADQDREPAAVASKPSRRLRTAAIAVAAAVLVAAMAAALVWRLKPSASAPLRKLDLALDGNQAKLAPDGTRIAFVAGDRLFVRELAAAEPRDLGAVAQEVNGIAWSPDGATILMVARDGKVRTISSRGGAALVVCDIPESREVIGTAWLGDDIVLAVWRGNLYRVGARGGTPKLWLATNAEKDIDFHGLAALPDGRVVFAAHQRDNRYTIETFDGTKRAALLPSIDPAVIDAFGTVGGFWYSPTGHLLYTRFDANHGLWAVPFDRGAPDSRKVFLVAPNAIGASVADDGTLLITNESSAGGTFELAALTRAGQLERTIGAASSAVRHPAVSPNGGRIAVLRATGSQEDLWVDDLNGGAAARLTFEGDARGHPAWFPDSERILVSEHAQLITDSELSVFNVEGSNKPQSLVKAYRGAVSSSGSELLFLIDERGSTHLRSVTLGADGRAGAARRVFQVDPEPDVHDFALSPDDRILAYVDYKNGQGDLLLTRYPGAQGRWQIATNGGRALWATDGSLRWARGTGELFFALSNTGDPKRARVMAAKIAVDRNVTAARPTQLFEVDIDDLSMGLDVAPDGQTIFMRRRVTAPQQRKALPKYVLVQNWIAEFSK